MFLHKLKSEYQDDSRIRSSVPHNTERGPMYVRFTGKVREYENIITKKIKKKEHGILYKRSMSEKDYKVHWFVANEYWWPIYKEDK